MTTATADTSYLVACAQTEPVLGDIEANIEVHRAVVRDTAARGASLVVLPEAASAGYMFADRAEARSLAQEVTTGPTVTAWRDLAAELGIWIAGGFTELADGDLFNSAALVGPSGVASLYRKVHLWNAEKEIYKPGDLGFPVVETPLGRLGLMVCYDAWFPESLRSYGLGGADLVCAPSNYVPVPGQPPGPTMASLMCMAGAHSNQLYVAAASRTGVERGQGFIGSSLITDHTGWVLAGPADDSGPTTLLARVDPVGSRAERSGNPFNQPLADRRPSEYRTEEP
ncbi:carbon-nitrogen hydrolase [Georgenia sp. 10Sc9-8]|uniref:Carbon-nitrogen hydrolase n=1 Tax=Georgenia halotolerans TaxID=3028317 RepID=A0ABT5TZ42_9MICO|nr:carbon-nitrogen hydrolase [Georgenia halotolerans]